MKVAILFSGQYREFDSDLFKYSLSNLITDIDYSIYSFCWKEKGESLDHSQKKAIVKDFDYEEKIKSLFRNFNLKKYAFESYEDFIKSLPLNYSNIQNSEKYHSGTIHSLPQLYAISKSFKLVEENLFDYDLIFRCRYDCLFIHPLNLHNLESIKKSNKLHNINFGRSYYPKRVYDIFFGGSPSSMQFLTSIWDEIPKLISIKSINNLDQRDSCRLIYLAACLNNIKVKSLDYRICDVYRSNKSIYYEKYIISSHYIKLNHIFKNKKVWFYLRHLFKYRGIPAIKMYLYLFQFLINLPFSYLKRIKFLYFFN